MKLKKKKKKKTIYHSKMLEKSPGRPYQFFLKKSKRRRFNKKQKLMSRNRFFDRVNQVVGSARSHRVFPSSIFSLTRPGFSPGQSGLGSTRQARPGFKTTGEIH
jgi:hypothetical protein